MKLNLEEILAKANSIYRERKKDAGVYEGEYLSSLGIRSDQVKALAEAFVEAINNSREG